MSKLITHFREYIGHTRRQRVDFCNDTTGFPSTSPFS